jgi:hypothetical protein
MVVLSNDLRITSHGSSDFVGTLFEPSRYLLTKPLTNSLNGSNHFNCITDNLLYYFTDILVVCCSAVKTDFMCSTHTGN